MMHRNKILGIIACVLFLASPAFAQDATKISEIPIISGEYKMNNNKGLNPEIVKILSNAEKKYTQGIYNYPVTPGTEMWKKLTSQEQMLQVLQIPKKALSKMTTDELITTCFQYPLLGNLTAFNTLESGFDNYIFTFNGVAELLRRPDAVDEILKYYKQIDLADTGKTMFYEKNSFKIVFTEMLLGQDEILDSLAKNSEFISTVTTNLNQKLSDAENFASFHYNSSIFVLRKILERNSYLIPSKDLTNRTIKSFEEKEMSYSDYLDWLVAMSENLIEKLEDSHE